jgi:2-keto-4-pentenoate hydratase
MDNHTVEEAAKLLWNTWQANGRITQIPPASRPATRSEAYRIQSEVARLSGQAVYGWKIAATSAAGQKHIGVDGPLAGRLLAKRAFISGANVSLSNNIMQVAEAEFAFRMARDFPPRSTNYSMEEILAGVETLHPAIEIPDSRYEDFAKVGAAQLIADCACAGYFVLGPACVADWRQIDLAEHAVAAGVNGTPVREGRGANVLGDPRIALAWLANELSSTGDTLRAGQVVTTGTCVIPVPVSHRDQMTADFGVIGRVEARFE